MLETEPFFSFDSFAYKELWVKGEPVWHPLKILSQWMQKRRYKIEIAIPQGVTLENKESISIGEGTVIEPGVLIQGPCIIGKRCVIRHSAYLRAPLLIGDDCHIGHSAELKNCILFDKAAATHFVYAGDSILGHGVNLGAGVKCANLRLDRKEVRPGMKKLGAILGDRVQIGCNAVLNPGTLVGKESIAYPLTLLRGLVPPHSQVDAKGVRPMEKPLLQELLWQSNKNGP
jgi:UDP-N-acetylglucosamine diphosphorylase / glucose-1-phosphate thymidylyltransferase / UDP-N-acetylgalactosamine diphosphorylase / glucosamine-1-phosphate N-acetyltransferase / galactosamine-1-phosphate N-acetyltransferase